MSSDNFARAEVFIREARSGMRESLGRLLETYTNYIRLVAATQRGAKLRARVSPSDGVQETFLQAHRTFGQFRGRSEAEFVAWLQRILASQLTHLYEKHLLAEKRDVRRFQASDPLDSPSHDGGIVHRDIKPSNTDDDALTVRVYREPSCGQLTLNEDGSFHYQRESQQTSVDSFTYLVDDGTTTRVAEVAFVLGSSPMVANSWQNDSNPLDVNNDGVVTKLDESILVDDLETHGERELPAPSERSQAVRESRLNSETLDEVHDLALEEVLEEWQNLL